jgi:hypothetical protein
LLVGFLKSGDPLPSPVRYYFRQNFAVSALEAYEWCTDFKSGPEDHVLMGDESADRQVKRIAESTVILNDTFHTHEGPVEKQKLVELYPAQLSWNSTHLTGPAKYSQFTYRITANGENRSHIDFTGLFLDYEHEKLGNEETERLAEKLCKDDSEGWKLLAKAMAKDFGK